MSTTLSTSISVATMSAAPTPSPSGGGGGGGGGGPTSSPLLFFVALGFGVVFTNLWIIVGVKYCFRYNQRNRRPAADENGEPIDMTALPRTHRRRREKKLMTMDEVNERFPMLKYKAWMTARAEEGLSTAGGVVAPSESRAASLRNVDGVMADSKESNDLQRPTTPALKSPEEDNNTPESTNKNSPAIGVGEIPKTEMDTQENPSATTTTEEKPDAPAAAAAAAAEAAVESSDSIRNAEEELEEDDQIQMAVPTEMMAMGAGDSCAICIDQLEDDEDVRGLTCGHAFHAHCLDPWLTSRRACCPLCKADYYVPKPRPEGEAAAEAERNDRGRRQGTTRTDVPRPPQYAFQRQGGPRLMFPSRFMGGAAEEIPRNRYGFPVRQPRAQRQAATQPPAPTTATDAPQPETWRSRFRGFVPNINMPGRPRRNNDPPANAGAPEIQTDFNTTPSQLEAGPR